MPDIHKSLKIKREDYEYILEAYEALKNQNEILLEKLRFLRDEMVLATKISNPDLTNS